MQDIKNRETGTQGWGGIRELSEWLMQDCILFTRDTFYAQKYRETENKRLKEWKTHAMQTNVAILISDKGNFKTRNIIRYKRWLYLNDSYFIKKT